MNGLLVTQTKWEAGWLNEDLEAKVTTQIANTSTKIEGCMCVYRVHYTSVSATEREREENTQNVSRHFKIEIRSFACKTFCFSSSQRQRHAGRQTGIEIPMLNEGTRCSFVWVKEMPHTCLHMADGPTQDVSGNI